MKNTFKGFIKALKSSDNMFVTRHGDTVFVLNPYSGVEIPNGVYKEFFVKDSPCFPPVNDGDIKTINFHKKNDFDISDTGIKEPEKIFNTDCVDIMERTKYLWETDLGVARIIVGGDKGMAVNTLYIDAVEEFGGLIESAQGTTGIVRITSGDVRFIMLPIRTDAKFDAVVNAILKKGDTDMTSYKKRVEELERQLRTMGNDLEEANKKIGILENDNAHLKAYIAAIESKAVQEADAEAEAEAEEPEEIKGIEVFDVEGYLEEVEDAEDRITDELIEALNETDGVTAELIGTWLWVTGNTKEHKEILKSLGFRWSGKKQAWYMAPNAIKRNYKARYNNMDAVRQAHTA